MKLTAPLLALVVLIAAAAIFRHRADPSAAESNRINSKDSVMTSKIQKSDDEWRRELTPEQYRIARQGGTEAPFTGKYYDFHGDGVFRCVCCGAVLFDSDTKYNSGSGWPSFYAPANDTALDTDQDLSLGMIRTEIRCRECGAHLGHLFDDGPQPTGLRYCINSAALKFEADTTKSKSGSKPGADD